MVAFNTEDIYKLWIHQDMAIFDVIAAMSDEELRKMTDEWDSYDDADEAIQFIEGYMQKRKELLK